MERSAVAPWVRRMLTVGVAALALAGPSPASASRHAGDEGEPGLPGVLELRPDPLDPGPALEPPPMGGDLLRWRATGPVPMPLVPPRRPGPVPIPHVPPGDPGPIPLPEATVP